MSHEQPPAGELDRPEQALRACTDSQSADIEPGSIQDRGEGAQG